MVTHSAQATLSSYVGLDMATKQLEKRFLQRGFHLNIMVVGESGLGKSTFLNSLFSSHLIDSSSSQHSVGEFAKQTTEITTVSHAIEENGIKMMLTLVDTPGYADQINNDQCWDPILRYIKEQYAIYLRRELSPNRDRRIVDTRVHCVLFFLAPTGHAMKPLDIMVMKVLSEIANVVPVIGKSDSMTVGERTLFKQRVRKELHFHGISVYPFEELDVDEDEADVQLNESIRQMIPFAVVGSEETMKVGDQVVRVRRNRSGLVNLDDPVHCEFTHLRDFIIRTHMIDLVETTALIHYETFRSKQLMALKDSKLPTQ